MKCNIDLIKKYEIILVKKQRKFVFLLNVKLLTLTVNFFKVSARGKTTLSYTA